MGSTTLWRCNQGIAGIWVFSVRCQLLSGGGGVVTRIEEKARVLYAEDVMMVAMI